MPMREERFFLLAICNYWIKWLSWLLYKQIVGRADEIILFTLELLWLEVAHNGNLFDDVITFTS